MKTSARNQFLGKVTAVKIGAVNDEIELQTSSGQTIPKSVAENYSHKTRDEHSTGRRQIAAQESAWHTDPNRICWPSRMAVKVHLTLPQ